VSRIVLRLTLAGRSSPVELPMPAWATARDAADEWVRWGGWIGGVRYGPRAVLSAEVDPPGPQRYRAP
jgi:hypothetical protein